MKKCSLCGELKKVAKFYKGHSRCKDCHNKITNEWKKNNREKVKQQRLKYRKKNRLKFNEYQKLWMRKKHRIKVGLKPEKYRVDENGNKIVRIKIKKQGKYSTRFAVLKRDNFTCQYCGRKAPYVVLEIDHKIPRSKGGSWKLENLITSCFECNRGKGDKL